MSLKLSPDWNDLARALVILLSIAASVGALWAWHDRRRIDPWQRLHQRLCAALRRAGVDALPHHGPHTLAALVRRRHGAEGEALAAALQTLDRRRHGPEGSRVPERSAWQPVLREAARLRGHSTALPAPAGPG